MKKLVNGVEVECTAEDIAEMNVKLAAWEADAANRMIKEFTVALENQMNEKATERSYTSCISCVSYANSTNTQWAAEAHAFIAWRDVAFEYAYDYLEQVELGVIQNPTIEGFLADVPALTWPELPFP